MSLDRYSNLKPKLVKNIFNEEEYTNLYNQIETYKKIPEYNRTVEELGYVATSLYLNKYVRPTLERVMTTAVHTIDIKNIQVHYARYSLQSGSKPTLMPHYDRGLPSPRYSFAIVLDNTLDWDIYVEGNQFSPRKNDAVLFSGSHHIHWRPDIEFKENDYYDILVCQFEDTVDGHITLDKKHRKIMDERNGKWCLEWEKLYDIETYNKKMGYN